MSANTPDWRTAFHPAIDRMRRLHRSHRMILGHLCPACQTPMENAEAVVHEATLEYGMDSSGRIVGLPIGGDPA